MSSLVISKQDVESFNEDGYLILRSVVPSGLREALEQSIVHSYAMQALKFLALREKLGDRPPQDFRTVEDLDEIVGLLEEHDREAAYQTLALVTASQGGRAFAAWEAFGILMESLVGCPRELTFMTPPSPFINQPNSKRLLQ